MTQNISKNRIKKSIYNAISELTSHIYRDEDWAGVSRVLETIREALASFNAGLTLSVSVVNGGYRTLRDGSAKWKEHNLSIENAEGEEVLRGFLNAHAAGTVEDPFCRYDMSVVLP